MRREAAFGESSQAHGQGETEADNLSQISSGWWGWGRETTLPRRQLRDEYRSIMLSILSSSDYHRAESKVRALSHN